MVPTLQFKGSREGGRDGGSRGLYGVASSRGAVTRQGPWRLAVVGQERGGCSGSRPVYPGAPDASIKVPQLRPCSQPRWEVGKCQRQKSFNRETSALLTLLQKPARLLFMLL